MYDLYHRILSLCEKQNINITEMCRRSGASRGALGNLAVGARKTLSTETLTKIANYFDVTVDYLLGVNPYPIKDGVVRVPIYGTIAAGIPQEAIENVEDYEEISSAMARTGEFLGLRIHGDSMEPEFRENDIIIVRKQETCENGDICAVLINGNDATCKKVKLQDDGMLLVSFNLNYDPMFYSREQIETLPVRIIGKVVEVRRNFEKRWL